MMNKIRINTGRVKTAMAAKGLKNETAAEQAGISRGSFDRILREGCCAAFTLGKIAKVLGIPVWELVEK